MKKSILCPIGVVPFAPHTNERVYMREFYKADGLPFDLARWQPTVDAMLTGVDVDGPLYLMVDQSVVPAGATQRRPGVHIDGYWIPALQAHGTPSHGATPPAPAPGGHGGSSRHMGGLWPADAPYLEPEALILASNVAGCRAFIGDYDGSPGDGGNCSHIDTHRLGSIVLMPHVAYAGNVTMLHESIPVAHACERTIVRLNVPGWTPATN